MTKKDYALISDAIRNVYHSHNLFVSDRSVIKEVAKSIAANLAKNNSSFNQDRFTMACTLIPDEIEV